MTLPPSDAHPSRILPQRPQFVPPTHSISVSTPSQAFSLQPGTIPPVQPTAEIVDDIEHERAIEFASHSWDLATGGLKTLTAKRELPPLRDRRPSEKSPEPVPVTRNYTVTLVILACVVLMLIGGSVVLFVVLQP